MLFLQLLINGLITGCGIGLVAVSFGLVYSSSRVFHVAHAGVYTLSGYLVWTLLNVGIPDIPAIILAAAISALIGAAMQLSLYEVLARRQASQLVTLIASLGLLAVIQNLIAMIYSPNILRQPSEALSAVMSLGSIVVTLPQLLTVIVSILAVLALIYMSQQTVFGKRIRAVSNNPGLASITMLKPRLVYVYVMAIASAVVSLAGIFNSYDLGLQPYNGTLILLTATVATIAGGIGSIKGAFLTAIGIAVLQNLSLLAIDGQWSVAITFLIFIVFMLFRPQGLFRAR
ncbi:MAG: branched-chain amino acid ABC transporter permease [Rhizobiaceae bacterium]|nr:branched-chain amino acid ABC transporter permease [Rhizobiaceae bacterium]